MNPTFTPLDTFKEVFTTKARYIDLWGGRGRGGSHFATDYFLFLITQPKYFRGYFMREILGDIRGSLWRDFKDRIEDNDTVDIRDFAINDNQMSCTYIPTGNTITSKGFKKSSLKQTAKLKSIAGATHVIIEECEEIEEYDFDKLDDSVRTTKVENIQILRLFNPPPKRHWLITNNYNLKRIKVGEYQGVKINSRDEYFIGVPISTDNHLSIHSTYLNNYENINQSTIDKINRHVVQSEFNKSKKEHYLVDYCGLIPSSKKGLIYPDWQINPYEGKHLYYYMDFGFNHPTAIGSVAISGGEIYVKELIHEPGLTNIINPNNPNQQSIEKRLLELNIKKTDLIITDSAEPKSIRELRGSGWKLYAIEKPGGSILSGIKLVSKWVVNVDPGSVNIIEERDNYKWKESAHELLDEPEDAWNHHMDGIRYVVMYCAKKNIL